MRGFIPLTIGGVRSSRCSCCPCGSLVRKRKGEIINISSQLGFVGFEKLYAYCASKGAIIPFPRPRGNQTEHNHGPSFIVCESLVVDGGYLIK